METLGERIAAIRLERDLSQSVLAKRAAMRAKDVSRLERAHGMHTATLVRLCRALDVSADWLLGLED